jgi:effector protein SdbA
MMNKPLNSYPWQQFRHPLIIASSGGGGHISAAESLIEQLKNQVYPKILPQHYQKKPSSKWISLETLIQFACFLSQLPGLKKYLPIQFPSVKQLQQEIEQLNRKNEQKQKCYIDFMLDIQPNGYCFVALFNHLQKLAHPNSLYHIVKHQDVMDKFYKRYIRQQIYSHLIDELAKGQAYDVVLSTQAIGIPAICSAIALYNEQRKELARQYQCKVPEIQLHQFITDIPQRSAQHYLKPLESLNYLEKQCVTLHLIDLKQHNYFLEKKHCHRIYRYHPDQNPMIRHAFRQQTEKLPFAVHCISILNHFIVKTPKEKLALILLSSSNGNIILDYLKSLFHMKIQHVVIAGQISLEISETISTLKPEKSQLYLPGFLASQDLSKLLKETDILVLKAGGLSIMEIASTHLPKTCFIGIHQAQSNAQTEADKGLAWEEGNAQWLLNQYPNTCLVEPKTLEQKWELSFNLCQS